jgi:hypothetical protein
MGSQRMFSLADQGSNFFSLLTSDTRQKVLIFNDRSRLKVAELPAWGFEYNYLMLPEYVEILIHSSGHEDISGRMVHNDKEA